MKTINLKNEVIYYNELRELLFSHNYGEKMYITNLNDLKVIDIIKYRKGFIELTKALTRLREENYISQFSYSNEISKANRGFYVVKG